MGCSVCERLGCRRHKYWPKTQRESVSVMRGRSETPLTGWRILSRDKAGRQDLNRGWNRRWFPAAGGQVLHSRPLLSRKMNNPPQVFWLGRGKKVKLKSCKLFMGFISSSVCILVSQAASLPVLSVLPNRSGSSGVARRQQHIQLSSSDSWVYSVMLVNDIAMVLAVKLVSKHGFIVIVSLV